MFRCRLGLIWCFLRPLWLRLRRDRPFVGPLRPRFRDHRHFLGQAGSGRGQGMRGKALPHSRRKSAPLMACHGRQPPDVSATEQSFHAGDALSRRPALPDTNCALAGHPHLTWEIAQPNSLGTAGSQSRRMTKGCALLKTAARPGAADCSPPQLCYAPVHRLRSCRLLGVGAGTCSALCRKVMRPFERS